MVAVNRKDWYGHIDVFVFVVDMTESTARVKQRHVMLKVLVPLKDLCSIAQHFQLTWLISVTIHAQGSHDLIH